MQYYDPRKKSSSLPQYQTIAALQGADRYIMSEPLQKAVNLAIFLGQPLLVTGEPGTGKTQLAHHLAHYFGLEAERDFFVFHTKSTSSANDLFYRYDALGHFQYAQNHAEPLGPEEVERLFIRYQALGAAIQSGRRCLVLIDEVDKAPRDLPNDVLDVMDRLAFEVPEIGKVGNAKIETKPDCRPIVVLTSNSEKNLPDAFLRRCVYYHIPFPKEGELLDILEARFGDLDEELLLAAIRHFQRVREGARRKMPSTAELLQWVAVLQASNFDFKKLEDPRVAESDETLKASYGVLVKDREDLSKW